MKRAKTILFIIAVIYAWIGLPVGIYYASKYDSMTALGIYFIFTICGWIFEGIEYHRQYGDAFIIFKR